MIYVLLEQEYNVMNSIEDEFIRKFKKSSVRRFGNERVAVQDLTEFKSVPLFDSCWLIICGPKMIRNLQSLHPQRNVILIKVTRKGQLASTVDALGSYRTEIIDNYKVDKEVVLAWIENELNISERLSKYLYNRVQGNLKSVVEGVRLLALLPKVTQASIRETVREHDGVSIYAIVQYMLGIGDRVRYEHIVQMLYDFRYATSWLVSSILQELKIYSFVYDAMDAGELKLTNYREYMLSCSNKTIRDMSAFRMKKLVESHNCVSTELVYFLIFKIESLPSGNATLPEIVKLIKVGGNNVYSM